MNRACVVHRTDLYREGEYRENMTYTTFMAHLELGQPNTGLLQVVGDLAERFHASVIGIAARPPLQVVYGEGYAFGELLEQDRQDAEALIKAAEAEFRAALQPRAPSLAWRSTSLSDSVSGYLAHEARSADLLITGVASGALLDSSPRVDMADLVLQLGRPLLVVPAKAKAMRLDRVVVGWTDTREARRATLDALPLLKNAAHVSLVEIADTENLVAARTRLDDVAAWLKPHGVMAETLALPAGDDDTGQLYTMAREQGADLIVAGAYGHSRLREWALGGVTQDLLRRANCCSLVSH